jgi:hypothetical protein
MKHQHYQQQSANNTLLFDLITHIRKTYIYFRRDINESVSDFYAFYEKNYDNPSRINEVGRVMSLLGFKVSQKALIRHKNSRKIKTTVRWYYITFEELVSAFDFLIASCQDN